MINTLLPQIGDEALLSENVCLRDSWHCEVGRGAQGTATQEFRKAKLMAKQITTLPGPKNPDVL